ncbi:ABC transporter substrate-binding protein [Anaerobacillus sp. MEB173]|uniref:ABC transporter substrate-binding protein n=1 Tax=Anaerobacillus sp. MEB173 TaxID=3383345 RepID=UPI003F939562
MKKGLFAMLLVLVLLMISACGSSEEAVTENDVDATEEVAEVTTEESAEFNLVNDGKFTFAMSGLYPPLNFTKDGELTGFDVEIGTEIANRLGLEANPVTNPWETIIQGLRANHYDAIIASMTATEERAEQVDFTNPYYISGAQIFVNADDEEIQSPEDLEGKTIGVIQSSTWRDMAEELSDKINGYPSDVNALQDLSVGRIDAVITDNIVGLSAMNERGLKIKPVYELLNEDLISVAVNKGNEQLVEQINEAIAAMIEDGTYEEISMKWFNENIMK